MTRNHILILTGVFLVVLAGFGVLSQVTLDAGDEVRVRVVPASDVAWEALNPLRGDKSPRAGTLWGDRGARVPSGFLVKFVDGFASPPHIHPVTYRGVVIHGLVHNDVPEAETVWLPPGTFWTQPAGEVHITAAKGGTNVAYIEIEQGPYLVHPASEAFERPEAPIKLPPGEMPWEAKPGDPDVVGLPGNPHDGSFARALVKLPAGFEGMLRSAGGTLHVVVIEGAPTHEVPDHAPPTELEPGSYFGSDGAVGHRVTCSPDAACLLYVRSTADFQAVRASAK